MKPTKTDLKKLEIAVKIANLVVKRKSFLANFFGEVHRMKSDIELLKIFVHSSVKDLEKELVQVRRDENQ